VIGKFLVASAAGAALACSTGSARAPADSPVLDAASSSNTDSGAVEGGGAGGGAVEGGAAEGGAHQGKPVGGAFVHLFEWRWTDIADECKTFLGPKGFAAVQVSPPSEHAVLHGFPWWQRYQTVEYGLEESRSGTREEFASMVKSCADAGVDIYVDAVINHMTGQASGVGSHGTAFQKYEYPGLYTATDFHRPTCTIADADYQTSAEHVQNCELLGLADLNTGDGAVRSKIAAYLVDLVRLGVRGFRIDAAKHMSPGDLDAILTEVAAAVGKPNAPYYFFEVIDYGGEAVHASDYFDVGRASGSTVDVTEFRYGSVGATFLGDGGQTLSRLKDLGNVLMPSERAVVFTNNHDTQRGSAIFYQDAPVYDLANVFMLAWPYGYPSIMSSYAFDRTTPAGRDQGPPSDGAGHTNQVSCALSPSAAPLGSWVCEHRARSVANMVAFRKATAAVSTVTDWWDNGANQVAFGRGNLGHVVINREAAPLDRNVQTQLAAGNYCDVVGGDFTGTGCSGPVIAVDGAGMAKVSLSPNSALAIHSGARVP
jgi:alpha-amylase